MKKFYRVVVLFIISVSISACYTLEEAIFTALDDIGITPPSRSLLISPKDDSPSDPVIEENITEVDEVDADEVDNRIIVTDFEITKPFFSHYNLAKTEEFEPRSEYTLRVEVENENAIPWVLKLYIQEEADSDYYIVLDFSGDGLIREQTISTENYRIGDEIEYYWEIELPGDDRLMRYGDWEDGFFAFDIKEDSETSSE